MPRSVYLVPHGEHDPSSGKLNREGKESARQARKLLLASEVGKSTIVLSSDVKRYHKTAKMVAKALKAEIVPAETIYEDCRASSVEKGVDLDATVSNWLKETPTDGNEEAAVVAIVSPDFIAKAVGKGDGKPEDVASGVVYSYVPTEPLMMVLDQAKN
jgi:hypothetical protein